MEPKAFQAGTNVLVVKPFTKHVAPFYQWILCIGGDEYESHTTKYRNGNFIFGVNAMSREERQLDCIRAV